MHSITLYRIDPARNMQRFYRLDIQPDLFGNACVIREWGRIGKPGQVKTMPFVTAEEAEREMQKQERIRTGRGYRP